MKLNLFLFLMMSLSQLSFAEETNVTLQVAAAFLPGQDVDATESEREKKKLLSVLTRYPSVQLFNLGTEDKKVIRTALMHDFDVHDHAYVIGYNWGSLVKPSLDWQQVLDFTANESNIEASIKKLLAGVETAKAKKAQELQMKTSTALSVQSSAGSTKSKIDLDKILSSSKTVIVFITLSNADAKTSAACAQVERALKALKSKYSPADLMIHTIDASNVSDAQVFNYKGIAPAVRVYKNKKEVKSFNGSSPELLSIRDWL